MLTLDQVCAKYETRPEVAAEVLKFQALGYRHGFDGTRLSAEDRELEVEFEAQSLDCLLYANEGASMRLYRAAVREGKADKAAGKRQAPPSPDDPSSNAVRIDRWQPAPVVATTAPAPVAAVPTPVAVGPLPPMNPPPRSKLAAVRSAVTRKGREVVVDLSLLGNLVPRTAP